MRIIPAYAGSTSLVRGGFGRPADHPRIRGEHPRNVFKAISQTRIIPAYAGSTCHRQIEAEAKGDHPRIRGEHF